VAIKQSVYAMPLSEQSREDLSWTLKEIVDGGGDGSISEARFVEGLTDEQIINLFRNARKCDYEKVLRDANLLLVDWSNKESDPQSPATRGPAQLSRLQRRLEEIAAIDFFQTPQRAAAELLLRKLGSLLSGKSSPGPTAAEGVGDLRGKTWVTRENLYVDRLACGWLIRRFVDPTAAFRFVPTPQDSHKPGEIRFDMFDGEYTHEGDLCTFEVMIQRLRIEDRALVPMAEIVHDIDLKDGKYGRSETDGFSALLTGLAASQPGDEERMVDGLRLFENLYAYFHRKKRDRPV
jgi:hypothetical protein